jgi:hypothetical protein
LSTSKTEKAFVTEPVRPVDSYTDLGSSRGAFCVLRGRMKRTFLNIYLRWLESRINLKVYDDILSRKIDRVKELLGE